MRIRTGFSFRSAVGHLPDVLARVAEIGWTKAPISDRASTFGFTRWTKLCKKAGIEPVYGVELAVVPTLGEKKPITDYWTFFAIDSLRPLHDLIARATLNPDKEPTLTYAEALDTPGLIKIAGERVFPDLILKARGDEDFYIGLSPSLPKALFKKLKNEGHQFIAVSDNVYTRATDREFYRVSLGRRSFTQTYPQHILADEEWVQSVSRFTNDYDRQFAINNRNDVMRLCKAKQKRAELFEPEKPFTLREMCEAGARRVGLDLSQEVYSARLEKELRLIEEKNFGSYFYIIADLVSWAKERMIVGPARGSSCGSLVCYLLDITTIDPIPFGLIFERFIDVNRTDLPDIDIDFSDARRQLVFDYAERKFGADHVARLGTVGLFKPRSALKQAGAGLRIPSWRIEKVLDGLVERSSADSRAMNALEDTLAETDAGKAMLEEFPEVSIANLMEGHPNTSSQHAAGIVVTRDPVREYVAVDMRTKATMCDKKDSEDLNLLKIDALGLTQLSIFERTLQIIGKPDKNGFLEKLPLDDAAAFDVLNNGQFAGIFQFTGMALQSLVRQVKIENIEDMISITALARPGPMATGGASSWVKRRVGLEPVRTQHEMLTELTKDTYGVTIYQEQVMNIVRKMGRMSWEDTSAIRKAMSGRMGDEFFSGYKAKFLAGAAENGISEDIATEIWEQINTFGSWAFNRSHAVAYGLVSYWCCWLKAHHPLAFAAATLDAESDPLKQIQLLRELKNEGIDYKAVDPDYSTDRWVPAEKDGRKLLVGPLSQIKGIGPSAVSEILKARKDGKPLKPGILKRLKKAKTEIDNLFPIEAAIQRFTRGNLKATYNIGTNPIKVVDCQPGCVEDGEEVVVIAMLKRIAPRDENDAANVQKRGFAYTGPTQALNMFIEDDTGEMFAKVGRWDFEKWGRKIVEHGRPGKAIWALKGRVPKDFRMISVKMARFIGDMDDYSMEETEEEAA
jgi:DNA-directed DNA polymerase III PolC